MKKYFRHFTFTKKQSFYLEKNFTNLKKGSLNSLKFLFSMFISINYFIYLHKFTFKFHILNI